MRLAKTPNWSNRTLFHLDNLHVMREMDSETVDLIATDPPFNKSRDFHATPDKIASGASFQDRWSWEDDVHQEWVDKLADDYPTLMDAIWLGRKAHSDGMGAYMCFMAVRLLEMRRILKPMGSIYLHCDPTASHYLRTMMDVIFGKQNFQNEIVWAYKTGGVSERRFSRKHDTILYYGKTGKTIFNPQKQKSYTKAKSRKPGTVNYGQSSAEFYIDDIGVYNLVSMKDVWDISYVGSTSSERTGFPTQKPLALYERIILASSDEGDVVLDPFAGCATTCVAAERLNRQWVGIDIWEGAHEVVLERFEQEGLLRQGTQGSQMFTTGEFKYTTEPPVREDDGVEAVPYLLPPDQRRRARYGWEKLSHSKIRSYLVESQKQVASGLVVCAGCGRKLETEFMELDHINPRASGGNNDISNRVLLCRPCNQRKKEKLTLPGLIGENKKTGWMENETEAKNALSKVIARLDGVKLDHP